MRATVVEIITTIEPSKRSSKHTLVIGPAAARSTADGQRWRLFDLAGNRVVTVDDIEKTFRSEPLQSLVARRRRQLENEAPENLPRAEYSVGNESRTIQGVPARQSIVRMGRYERQLWIATHPQIPPQLFAMMHAAEEPSALAPVARGAEEALLAMRGFPLIDHAELPYGNDKFVIDRSVTAIRQEQVSAAMLQIPRGYRELPSPRVPAPRPVKRAAPKPPAPTDTTATTDTQP